MLCRSFVRLGCSLLLVGCTGPLVDLPGESDAQSTGAQATTGDTSPPDTTSPGPTGPSPTTSPPTATSPATTETTSPTAPTTVSATFGTDSFGTDSGGSTGYESVGFLPDPPDTGDFVECSTWDEDCPAGEKCMPWANDGGSVWNATKCTPLAPNPGQPGEACMVEGSAVSGVDTCDVGSMCWDVDPGTKQGTCEPFCVGSPEEPGCDAANRVCHLTSDGV